MVGNRDAVIGKKDDANGAAFERDVVDVEAAIVVDGRRELLEVCGQAGGVELADEDFGETRLGSRAGSAAAPTLRIVDGEGGLVEIALELKAGLFDKFLVFGLAGNRRQLAGGVEGPNPLAD